jgi:hypothetical protein
MTLRDPDSPVRRMTIAIAVAVAIMVMAGLVYLSLASKDTSAKFNGAAIVTAARDYTRDLQARKQPIPQSVTLEELVALHFLQPAQVEAFRGSKATIMLTADASNPQGVLMRVHMPDGSEFVLLNDGTAQQVPQK